MRTITLGAALLIAVSMACSEPRPTEVQPAQNVPLEQIATATPDGGSGPEERPPPTMYAPYGDTVWPTPTIPGWMSQLGPPGTATGARRTDLSRAGEAKTKLLSLEIADSYEATPYQRSEWGDWTDADGDCQDTRSEVLQEESRITVTFRSEANCRVDTGEWIGPWSGQRFTQAGDLDVDHHVPLANAHRSGAADWPGEMKRAFANDRSIPGALNATMNTLNRQKGARGPDEWRPPDRASWCRYATDWIEVKSAWQLTITARELRALTDMLGTCGS